MTQTLLGAARKRRAGSGPAACHVPKPSLPARERLRAALGNFVGAFADGAVLFPLLAAMSAGGGFSGPVLLASAGGAYLVAAAVFRVPMSIQPLKSIAIAALAVGASSGEVRLAAGALACSCLALSVLDVDRLAARVPVSLVHGLQLGLGVVLVLQGTRYDSGWVVWALAGLMVWAPRMTRLPVLGLAATAGLLLAVVAPAAANATGGPAVAREGLRWTMVLSLVLPQLALTLANSVIGTRNAAGRYFGPGAARVTHRALLRTIGLGNIASAAVGGLPFCHGSGGLTAHVRGGATHWVANLFVGGALLCLAGAQLLGGDLAVQFPPVLLASLLVATGLFHLGLAQPTWSAPGGRWKLVAAACVALATRNMLWVLVAGVTVEYGVARLRRWTAEAEAAPPQWDRRWATNRKRGRP